MKNTSTPIRVILILSSLVYLPAWGKYSKQAFNIPCTKINVKVETCAEYRFSNISRLSERQKQNKKIHHHFVGSILTGAIQSQEAIKCNEKQNVNFKSYKEIRLQNKLFVNNKKCNSLQGNISLIRQRFFCDTPGAPSIKECFLRSYAREKSFEYTVAK